MSIVQLKSHPVLSKALSGYTRKRSAIIVKTDLVTCHGTYWDGGSKKHFAHLTRAGQTVPVPTPSAPPQFSGTKAPQVEISPLEVIVELGVSCGKPAYPVVYIREEDLKAWGLSELAD